jgi:hypothetical protein
VSFVVIYRLRVRYYPEGAFEPLEVEVLFCDECSRWGAVGSTHICHKNWRPRFTDLLNEIVAARM